MAGLRTRSWAHLRDQPAWIADSWSAAALLGIPAFADGIDACVIRSHNRNFPATSLLPARRRPFAGMHHALTAPQALILCPQQMDYPWFVHPVPTLNDDTIGSVKVIDAFRRHGVTFFEVAEAAYGTFDRRWLLKLWEISNPGVESNHETTLRLVVAQVAPDVQSQVLLYDEFGNIITRFDPALEDLRIGLMYDGIVHWTPGRRAKDIAIINAAHRLGWHVLRVETGMLKNPLSVQLQKLIALWLAEG